MSFWQRWQAPTPQFWQSAQKWFLGLAGLASAVMAQVQSQPWLHVIAVIAGVLATGAAQLAVHESSKPDDNEPVRPEVIL